MAEKLLVTVVKAVNLLSKDSNGLSDPYVVLKVGAARYRTRTVPETLDPVFDETFVLSVNQFEPVRVEVWDYDQLSQDDFEGGFTLRADGILGDKPGHQNIDTDAHNGRNDAR